MHILITVFCLIVEKCNQTVMGCVCCVCCVGVFAGGVVLGVFSDDVVALLRYVKIVV